MLSLGFLRSGAKETSDRMGKNVLSTASKWEKRIILSENKTSGEECWSSIFVNKNEDTGMEVWPKTSIFFLGKKKNSSQMRDICFSTRSW